MVIMIMVMMMMMMMMTMMRKRKNLRMMLWMRTDPNRGEAHFLHEPAQSKRTLACHKSIQ